MAAAAFQKTKYDKSNVPNYSCHHPALGEDRPGNWGQLHKQKLASKRAHTSTLERVLDPSEALPLAFGRVGDLMQLIEWCLLAKAGAEPAPAPAEVPVQPSWTEATWSPLHPRSAHSGTQLSTTRCRHDSTAGRAFQKLGNNLPPRACTPALSQQRLSSYFSCIVMLNNAVKEVKNVYLLFLCPKSLLGLDSVCAKTLSTGDWHVCFNHSLWNDLNYHVVKKWVLV